MKPKFPSRLAFPLASAIAALLASSSVHAGQIWDGSGLDNNWNTAGNWDSDVLPTFTNAITFVGNTRNGAVNNLSADSIIGGINLTNDGTSGKTNAFTLSGNRITLGGNIITTASSSAITDTISLYMILNADRTITTNTNHNLTVSGIISQSGTRKLTKDGAGILTLSNANSYSGGTTINSGTLNVANVSGLGASGSTVGFNAASTLRLSTDTAFGGANPVYNVQMTGPAAIGGGYTGTIELNRATAGAYTGITHNLGQLTISLNGGGAATLNVTAGANAAGALDTIAFSSMSAGNNNTVTETLNPTGGNITIGSLTAAGNSLVTMALSGTTTGNAITGVIGGTGDQQKVAISKIGNSIWTLSNASNNYTGGTTFSAGTLVFASGALGTTGAITGSGGTLKWASGNTQDISSRLAMTAATSTFDTNGNNVNFASAIGSAVAAALTKTGTGTLTLQGTNTYTAATTVNLGTLSLDYGTNDTTKLANAAVLNLGGGTVNLTGASGSHVEVVASTTLTANTASYVTRTGATTATLQMGAITPNTGTLDIGTAGIATTTNTHTAGTILGTWATVGGADWAISGTAGTNAITAYASYTDVARLGTPGAGIRTIADGATTNVRLTEGSGASGTVTLGAATTQINTLNQSISGPGTSAVTVALPNQILRTNGILQGPTAGSLTIGAAGGTAALSGTLSSTAATGSIVVTNNSSNALTINSVIANNTTTSLVKNGTGVLVLTGASTYTGGTILQDGTIRAGASATILGSTNNNGITIANKSTAVFDLAGFNVSIKDLKGGGTLGGNVTLGSGTLTLANPSGVDSYNGTISGTGNFTVGGSSGWNNNGVHTYTGITTLSGANNVVIVLADGGIASGIGQSSSAASNLVFTGGFLSYNSATVGSTNRQFTLGGNATLGVSSTGAINWTSTAAITHSNVAAKSLTLGGAGAGGGTLAAQITDSGTGANITSVRMGRNHAPTSGANWSITNTNNTFTGAITFDTTTFTAGTLSYASAGGANAINFLQTTSTATLSYIGATDKTMSGQITASALTTGTITFDSSGAGAVNYSLGTTMGAAASGNKNLILSGANTGNNILAGGWNNNTGGAATITKNGASRWTLSGTNNYTGLTVVNAGTLQFAKQVSLYNATDTSWTAANINVKNGATLAVNVDSAGTNGFTDLKLNTLLTNISVANTAAQGLQAGATLGFDTSTANLGTFTQGNLIANSTGSGAFHGAIGVTKLGTGTLVFDKANTYTGATLISAGTLQLGNGVGGGTTGALTGTASISNNGNLTINRSNPFTQATDLNNKAITGTGSFTQAGGGITTLSLTNAYTGATTVSNGTLIVNGSISTSVLTTVQTGATLKGQGTVGALTVNGGGTLASGTSIESLATGNLTLLADAIFEQEINDLFAGGNLSGDLTAVTGTLNLALTNDSILNLLEVDTSGLWSIGDKVTLISYTGAWNGGLFEYLGNVLNDNTTFTLSGVTWEFDYNDTTEGSNFTADSNGTFVTMTVVPEPRAALLGGVGLLMLLRRRRTK